MFVDASAIIAILNGEADGDRFPRGLESVAASTSAIAIYEAANAVAREKPLDVSDAAEIVFEFLDRLEVEVAPTSKDAGRWAVEASARFGKRSGHPAKLDMGDCFSYAMAKQLNVPLLYKGDDFARIDLA